ncbi:MAG: class I SAM-dependent methyltransferase [Candidatus Heimdallarchaeota archaeon]|nr:MAG: class I SAM-dependent methyltransferase [Candidatus Heimdallarchaeota archaeon]
MNNCTTKEGKIIPHRIFDFLSPIYDILIRGEAPVDLVPLLSLTGDEVILEIGAGTGRIIQSLSHLCSDLFLLDPSPAMLAKARKKVPCANHCLGYAESLPFEEMFFDRVFAIDSLHHWNDQLKGLIEIYRVLKNEGSFILVEFDPNTRFGHYIKSMERFLRMGSKFYSPREIRKLLSVTGLTVSKQYYIDGATYVTVARKAFG